MSIAPPAAGENVDQLWRKVVELTAAVNALLNMTVKVQTKNIKSGKILSAGEVVLVLE